MAGKRYSRQRELIYHAVKESYEHPTADMVYHQLKPSNPDLSLGTVYRNLNLLSQEGLLRRMAFPVERYDGNLDPHPHLRCNQCGKVYDLDYPHDERLTHDAAGDSGHQLQGYDLTFYGNCSQCREVLS